MIREVDVAVAARLMCRATRLASLLRSFFYTDKHSTSSRSPPVFPVSHLQRARDERAQLARAPSTHSFVENVILWSRRLQIVRAVRVPSGAASAALTTSRHHRPQYKLSGRAPLLHQKEESLWLELCTPRPVKSSKHDGGRGANQLWRPAYTGRSRAWGLPVLGTWQ